MKLQDTNKISSKQKRQREGETDPSFPESGIFGNIIVEKNDVSKLETNLKVENNGESNRTKLYLLLLRTVQLKLVM